MRFLRDEAGAAWAEYAMIIALIVAGGVIGAVEFGPGLLDRLGGYATGQ